MSEATLLPGFRLTRGRLLAYAGGEGPPIVLLHGLGGSATNWTLLAPLLARRRRVLVPDLPGHGRSAPVTAPGGLGSLADSVAELIRGEGVGPVAVVGHSMGADVAIRLALRHPGDVSALVLVSAGALASSRTVSKLWLRGWGVLRLSRLATRWRRDIAGRRRLRRVAFSGWGAEEPERLTVPAALGLIDGTAHARDTGTAREALIVDDPRMELHGLSCRVLLVWGARDRSTPLEDGFEYARRLQAPVRTVAGAGHLVIVEQPETCAALIEGFLD
jgi:magnesium chelatase accessory protein